MLAAQGICEKAKKKNKIFWGAHLAVSRRKKKKKGTFLLFFFREVGGDFRRTTTAVGYFFLFAFLASIDGKIDVDGGNRRHRVGGRRARRRLTGALVATLPVTMWPAFLFLSLEHDTAYIAQAALSGLVINAVTGLFLLVYAMLAQKTRPLRQPRRGRCILISLVGLRTFN